MKYTGRIIVPFILVFAFLFDKILVFIMEARIDHPISLIAIIPFTILGWWLGEQYDHARYASQHDSLTSAYNRRYLNDIFAKLTARALRKNIKLECCVLDVNEFKSINDTSGHIAGDVVLRNIAGAIRQVGGKKSIVVRWGGDEFVVFTYIKAHADGFNLTELERRLSELSYKTKQDITISAGTAIFPDDGQELEELVHQADLQMYRSKSERSEENREHNEFILSKRESVIDSVATGTDLLAN